MFNCNMCNGCDNVRTEIGFNWTDIWCYNCGISYSYLNNNNDIENKYFIRFKDFIIESVDNLVVVVDGNHNELESKRCANLLESIEYMKVMFNKYNVLSVYL